MKSCNEILLFPPSYFDLRWGPKNGLNARSPFKRQGTLDLWPFIVLALGPSEKFVDSKKALKLPVDYAIHFPDFNIDISVEKSKILISRHQQW